MATLGDIRNKYGLTDDGKSAIAAEGATFNHAGPSGESKQRDNIYNDVDSGAIYSKSSGDYIGSISQEAGLANAKLEKVFRQYADEDNDFNSHNDVAFAVQKAHEMGIDVEPEEEEPIVHSPEVREAKERSAEWIRKTTSGEYSESIFGGSNDLVKGINAGEVKTTSNRNPTSGWKNYKFDQNYGEGIKQEINNKLYKVGLATPQNTNEDSNAEGF